MISTVDFSSSPISMRIYSRFKAVDLALLSSHCHLLSPWLTALLLAHSPLLLSISYTRALTESRDLCNIYIKRHLRLSHLCSLDIISSHWAFPCRPYPFYYNVEWSSPLLFALTQSQFRSTFYTRLWCSAALMVLDLDRSYGEYSRQGPIL